MRRVLACTLIGVGLAAGVASSAALGQCRTVIETPPGGESFDGLVRDLAAFDDGSGRGVQAYVCGQFGRYGSLSVGCVARVLAGRRYEAVGNNGAGLAGSARAMAAHTDATGRPRLYVAGTFGGGNLAAWDGASWTISSTPFTTPVMALKSMDVGEGPRLYAGLFGGGVWSFDGQAWSRVGPASQAGAMNRVQALAAYDDDGDGPNPPRVYIAGAFTLGQGISGLARFDGTQWVGVPGAPNFGWAKSLEVFDDGRGRALYVGSHPVQGISANACISRWDGVSWTHPAGPDNRAGFDPAYGLAGVDMGDGWGNRLYSYTGNGTIRSGEGDGPWWMYNIAAACSAASQVDYRSTMLAYRTTGSGTPVLLVPNSTHRGLVRTIGCPRCAADFDLDGAATVGDVFRFLPLWFEPHPAADVDESGEVTIDDLFLFLASWYSGCGA